MHIEAQIGLSINKRLGKGSFGTVYECQSPENGCTYAVKVYNKDEFAKEKLHRFRKESEILESIEHPNVVKFHSFHETENCLYLLMEFISGGTLRELIRDKRERKELFTDEEASQVIRALLEGIKHLHSMGIIHRDVKPENILIAQAGDLSSVKIADFGLSAQVDSRYSKNVKAQCGTLLYMAPEIFFQPSYSKAVDIWCCAVILYILLKGKHPIFKEGMSSEEYKLQLNNFIFPSLDDPLANNFIQRISQHSYADRYSANEALRHPWITRNKEDEIPLSVNESIHSFNTAHSVSDVLKFSYFVGKLINKNWHTPSQYIEKVHGFTQVHRNSRSRSPSFKNMSKKTKDAIIKIQQIYNQGETNKKCQPQYEEISSPLMRKHEKLFSRLFQKGKNQQKKQFMLQPEPISITPKARGKNQIEEDESAFNSSNMVQFSIESFCQIHSPRKPSQTTRKIIGMYDSILPSKVEDLSLSDVKKCIGMRKLNSLRSDYKHQQKTNYFKDTILKGSSFDIKESYRRMNSRQATRRFSIDKTIDPRKSHPKKPLTSGSKRSNKTGKQARPMIFGMGGGM